MNDPRFIGLAYELVRYGKDGAISFVKPSFKIPGNQGPDTFFVSVQEPISRFKATDAITDSDLFKYLLYRRDQVYLHLGSRLVWPKDYEDCYEIEYVLDYQHLIRTFPMDLTGLLK